LLSWRGLTRFFKKLAAKPFGFCNELFGYGTAVNCHGIAFLYHTERDYVSAGDPEWANGFLQEEFLAKKNKVLVVVHSNQ